MRKAGMAAAGAFLILFSLLMPKALPAEAPTPLDDAGDVEIAIQVSPSTILLEWNSKGDARVTVHAEVSFSKFDPSSFQITLANADGDEVSASYIKADARGELVAKFPHELIAEMVGPGPAVLHLRAVGEDGNTYFGEDEIRVVGD
jgi:hypothetical protein